MAEPGRKKIVSKPRVLIILNRFVIGGQAADTIPLASYLQDDFEILILYGEKEKNEIEPLFLLQRHPQTRLKKIKHLKRSINPFVDGLAFFSIIGIIREFKPHIVHTHGSKPGLLGRLAGYVSSVPVIIHTFHGHFFHSYFSRRISESIAVIERGIGKITTCAIALSSSQKDELVEQYKILPASKIAVIPLGFAFTADHDSSLLRDKFRKKYHLNCGDLAIGIIGRIVPVKNHSFFVKVVEKILLENRVNPPAFFIVGDGDLRRHVEDELNDKKISFSNNTISPGCRVVFTSWLTDIVEVVSGLDIVVLTSLNEGTPLSVIEAQFFKKPVVATNAGGVKDSMEDGVTGFVVEQDDLTTFTDKIGLLARDQRLRQTMGEAGKQFVSAKFSKQKEVSTIKELYLSLLAAKGYY